MDPTTFMRLLNSETYENEIEKISDLSCLTSKQVKDLLGEEHSQKDVDRLIELGIQVDPNHVPYMGESLEIYEKFHIPIVDVLKMSTKYSRKKIMSTIIQKDVSIVRSLNIEEIIGAINSIEDLELLIEIVDNYDWSGESKLGISMKDLSHYFFGLKGKYKNVDLLLFFVMYRDELFRYVAEKYISECTQSLVIAYCVRECSLENLRFVIGLGYSIEGYESKFSILGEDEEVQGNFKQIVRLLFKSFNHDDLFELLLPIFRNNGDCISPYIISIVTIYLCKYGYKKRLSEKLEELK